MRDHSPDRRVTASSLVARRQALLGEMEAWVTVLQRTPHLTVEEVVAEVRVYRNLVVTLRASLPNTLRADEHDDEVRRADRVIAFCDETIARLTAVH